MIKEDLVRSLSEELADKIRYSQAKQYIDSMLVCLEEVLLDKKKIMIRNFGSLVLRKKKERIEWEETLKQKKNIKFLNGMLSLFSSPKNL